MKKQSILLAAMALLLAACSQGGNSSSSPSSPSSDPSSSSPGSSSSASSTNPFIEAGWSTEEAALLYPLLEDYVYPYYDFKSLGYTYEISTYQESHAMRSFSLVIENFPYAELDKYFAFMNKQDGFVDKRQAYDTPAGYYVFEKTFAESYSYIAGTFHITDASGSIITEGTGTFELDIHPSRVALKEWLGSEVEKVAEAQLGEKMSIPEPSEKGAKYISYLTKLRMSVVPTLAFVGKNVMESYSSDLEKAGWKKVSLDEQDRTPANSLYYVSSDEKVGVTIYLADDASYEVTILQFEKPYFFLSYPSEKMDECLEGVYYSTQFDSLPVPSFEGTTYYVIRDYTDSERFFYFEIHGGDNVLAYEELLLKEGKYHRAGVITDGSFVYVDSGERVYLTVSYNEDFNLTTIMVNPNLGYHASWPTNLIGGYIEQLGGKTNLPVDAEADFVIMGGDIQSLGYFEVNIQSLDANDSLIDASSRYEALLSAEGSGWSYDSIEKKWHDEDNKVGFYLHFVAGRGTVLHVEPYVPSKEALTEEELSSAFKGIGVEGYSFIAFDGADGYSLDTSNQDRVYITVWGVDGDAEINAYKEKLLSHNHSTFTINDTYIFWDNGKKVGFDLVYNREYRYLTIDILEYSYCYNYSEANLNSFIDTIKQNYDSSFSIPFPPSAAGTMGLIRLTLREEGTTVRLALTIFESPLVEKYGEVLIESGWRASGSQHYLYDAGERHWSMQVDEYDDYVTLTIDGTPQGEEEIELPYLPS